MELSNSISNEHNDETSFEINYELANTRMYCRDLEYRLKRVETMLLQTKRTEYHSFS